jgi:hypothetical protein
MKRKSACVQIVRDAYIQKAMAEAELADDEMEAEAAAEEAVKSKAAHLDALPAADDLMTVVVANVRDWSTLMHLRTVAKWVGGIASKQMSTVGLRCGPRMHDFDTNGVLHLLGSAFGRSPWSLGEVAQRVRVFASDGSESSPPLDAHPFFPTLVEADLRVKFNNPVVYLLDRTPRRVFLSGYGVGAWMGLDLGRYVRVTPEAFTLRHSSQQDRALRSFRLDGSNADVEQPTEEGHWTPLLDVRDDQRLGVDEHSSASWELPRAAVEDAEEEAAAYRFFRIVKTGPDAMEHMYLHLSGFELYGRVSLRGLAA